ncbi:MAG: carbohydrate ABC transporter substrate-binding protein, partial [Bilifractor sp.]
MKKRMRTLLSLAMAAALVVPMAACGSSSTASSSAASSSGSSASSASTSASSSAEEETTAASSSSAAEATSSSADASGEGTVLNIQCWNDEFANRLAAHYPGFEAADPNDATKGGKIGDVTVKFTVTPSDDNAYQNNLDTVLPQNADASADKKVDIFLVEADYALKYIDADADVAMKLSDLGITDDDLSKQYQYTKDVVTDANGDIRGSSWQACSAGLIFNRDIAKKVLGT